MGYRAQKQALVGLIMNKDKEKDEQLALAAQLSRLIISKSDINELCRDVAFLLKELMSIDWAAIGIIEQAKDTLHLAPLSPRVNSSWELGHAIRLGGTPIDWIARNKKALAEPDLKTESRFWTGASWLKEGVSSIVYMPLFSRGEVFGSLIIGSHRSQAYGERELKLVKYTAAQIAIPIEHARLLQESKEREGRKLTEATPNNAELLRKIDEMSTNVQQALEKFSLTIAEYAEQLNVDATAIRDLNQAVQELRAAAQEQNRMLSLLRGAITEQPTEPRGEEKPRR